jgi:hypothetical protein
VVNIFAETIFTVLTFEYCCLISDLAETTAPADFSTNGVKSNATGTLEEKVAHLSEEVKSLRKDVNVLLGVIDEEDASDISC